MAHRSDNLECLIFIPLCRLDSKLHYCDGKLLTNAKVKKKNGYTGTLWPYLFSGENLSGRNSDCYAKHIVFLSSPTPFHVSIPLYLSLLSHFEHFETENIFHFIYSN